MNRSVIPSRAAPPAGFTLVELMIAVGIGSLLTAFVASLWLYSSRSFITMGNYADLDTKSRRALDLMSHDLREATEVAAFQKNSTVNSITISNANAGTQVTYIWNAASRTLVCQKPGQANQVYLSECDRWDFQLYQRSPQAGGNYVFFPATNSAGSYDLSICKLINMSWKCTRAILGSRMNSESVQTAQVVLRNKR